MIYRGAGAALSLAVAVAAFDDACAQDAAPQPTPPPPAESGDGAVVSYPAAFYAEFRPTNANEMIQRTPGFSLKVGDDVRGFAGSAGNVLINGLRPSSKTVGLDQLLQRIPASAVERIDVIRGGAPGIDMQGQPVVANVIRVGGASTSRAVQVLVKPYTDGFVGIIPRVEQVITNGGLQIDSFLGGRFDRRTESGDGVLIRRSPTGALLQSGSYDNDTLQRQFNGSTAVVYQRTRDIFRVNGAFEREDIDRRETGALTNFVTGGPLLQLARTTERKDVGEVGADYQRNLNDWLKGQLIGLKTYKREKQTSVAQGGGATQAGAELRDAGESILRGVLTATVSPTLRLEGGGEGALNSLESSSKLAIGGVPQVLPSANIRVEERRAEGFITASWRASSKIQTEAGLRWETSTITQTGGANLKKRLSFPKPRLIVSYAPDSQSQIRGRIERVVGQLDFKDFTATTQPDAGTVNVGNPNLVPERAWVFEAALERRFWGRGAAVLTFTHSELEQVRDLIPIAGRFDAPGNIGDGRKDELKLSLTVPLEKLGVAGGLVRFNGTWRWSQVTDPVTGQMRGISNLRPFEGDLYVAKTLPSLKSTIAVEADFGWSETAYRINEIRKTVDEPLWKLYWDWNPRPDLMFRFQVENFTAKTRRRDRLLFTGPRSLQQVNFDEHRTAELAPFLMMRVRKTFG